MSKKVVITVPDGVNYQALVYLWSAATTNAPEATKAAQRAAHRNGCDTISLEDFRGAVELLRLVAITELARLSGAPASIVSASSSVLIQHGEGL